jgi:hypothetical protein
MNTLAMNLRWKALPLELLFSLNSRTRLILLGYMSRSLNDNLILLPSDLLAMDA